MKNYLSFGGGVNSVAMYLLLMDQGMEPGDPDKGFEAVFVDHGTDWPETYEYVDMFKEKYPLTVLEPKYGGISNLYDYCWRYKMLPSMHVRWCTRRFKVDPLHGYFKKPCFSLIGIDASESKRAKLSTEKDVEKRYPLIESGLNRDKCVSLIESKNLPVPRKSGCFICPFQPIAYWKELRMIQPDLFCKAEQLEKRNHEYRKSIGKGPAYLIPNKKTLRATVQENQSKLWKEDEYPPCECML